MFVEGSHTFSLNEKAQVTPYVNLTYAQVKMNSFTEKGGDTILHNNARSNGITTTTLGARGTMHIGNQNQHTLYADLGWLHRFGTNAPKSSLNFTGGKSYRVEGVEMGKNSAIVGVGGNFQLKPNLNFSVGYEGEYGSQVRDNALKLQLNWAF